MKVTEPIFKRELYKECISKILKSQDSLFCERAKQIANAKNDSTELKNICKIDVNKLQRQEMIGSTKLFDFQMKCNGLLFKNVFPIDDFNCGKNRLNASNPSTNDTIFNALKYQCICIYDQLTSETEENILYILKLFCCKLLQYVNNSITYNEKGKISYIPYTTEKIENSCKNVYKSVFVNKNFTICTYAGEYISMDSCLNCNKDNKLNAVNGCKTERFSESQIKKYIEMFVKTNGKNPTIDELTLFVCEDIMDEHQYDENLSFIKYLPSRNVIWYYIKKFNLAGKLNVCTRNRKKNANVND